MAVVISLCCHREGSEGRKSLRPAFDEPPYIAVAIVPGIEDHPQHVIVEEIEIVRLVDQQGGARSFVKLMVDRCRSHVVGAFPFGDQLRNQIEERGLSAAAHRAE